MNTKANFINVFLTGKKFNKISRYEHLGFNIKHNCLVEFDNVVKDMKVKYNVIMRTKLYKLKLKYLIYIAYFHMAPSVGILNLFI